MGERRPREVAQEIQKGETGRAPELMMATCIAELDDQVSVDRYIDRSYHDREVERTWRQTWQVDCREEDIPELGDRLVYDTNDSSIVVVRGRDGDVRAFYISWLHRGAALCEGRSRERTSPATSTGMQWALDGSLKALPSEWDFPGVYRDRFHVPSVQVGHLETCVRPSWPAETVVGLVTRISGRTYAGLRHHDRLRHV